MKDSITNAQSVGNTLLEIGALLMSSGASTHRTRITMKRIANSLGYRIELLITQRALMLTIIETDQEYFFSRMKRISPLHPNFKMVSGISHLSWNVKEQNWPVEKINTELQRLKSLPHYPRWILLVMVGAAGAGFCNLFGGDVINMGVAFIATVIGLFTRQEAVRRKFNPYLSVFFAALVASFIAGLSEKFAIGAEPDKAVATSVLFLVPGIPLINSVTDMFDGNIQNGIVRAINGLIIAFAIALGLFTSKMILNF
ncbi:threonine/serine exporter family protein [Prolixibacteraceae bacterium Z1-6]|uniref:Threonine/serine exporter family protein n=1 Tax=Draconibacterium aestuarii TaxID=2998507 RepID=A0A9X3F980_9BACT|nr:threonine/serine exporter family protein [Prolixibacteraceae bacterium Z1-6]